MLKIISVIIFSLILSGCTQKPPITNFDSCVAAGNPVMESYPPRCAASGQSYTQDIGNELEMTDTIKVSSPRPNVKISSPLTITGEARGSYFFEAQFPVKLLDQNDQVIAEGAATAIGEWMTEAFVPFTATLTFNAPPSGKGNLILENDNPSGMPENNLKLRIPVIF